MHPHLNVKGGSERLTKVLIDGLHARYPDNEYLIVTGVYTEDWFGKYANKIKLLKLGMTAEELKDALESICRDFQPDVAIVMVQEPYYCHIIRTACPRARVCMYVHFPIDEEISEENLREYEKHLRYPTLTPKYIDSPHVIVTNSRRTKLAVDMLWPCDSRVVYPCIDDIFFREEPDLEKRRENVVLYVGRFVALKRQDVLLAMLPQLKQEVPDVHIVIAGFVDPRHTEYYEHVKSIVEELQDKYKDVELVPSPSDEKLLELYRLAKVYVHLRIGEHFGMAPVEAMSQGVPFVMRLPTGLAEVFMHGQHGFFVESDYAFLKYTVRLLKLSHDEYLKMSKTVVEAARRFTSTTFAEEMMRVLLTR